MKQFRVVALSSRNQLLVVDSNKKTFQFPFEGFSISPDPAKRPLLQDLIGKHIQCTLNKTSTRIRYLNQPFFTQKIQLGAIEVVQKELQQSRVYNPEQKARLLKCQSKEQAKVIELINVIKERKEMLRLFPRGGEVKGNLQWLGQEIVISYQQEGKIVFLPIRLKTINTLFECVPEKDLSLFIEENSKISVKVDRPLYNLVKKRFQLVGHLSPQIQLNILNQGWGTVNTAALANSEGPTYSDYLKAEDEAKQAHKGVFSRNCQILAFIYAKNNFVGEVSDVFDGYIFEITKKGGEKVKLELAMVRCPVGDQVGAFNSRQFARKQLIGQEVNVYLHKDSGLNITGSVIRARDSKDVEAMLVEQGWGFIRQQFVSSVLSIKLSDLEKRAKEKFRGLHSKEVGVHRPEDLTLPNTQKEDIYYYRRDEVLKRLGQSEVGVLEGFSDLLTYRVWLQEKNVVLKVKLQGLQSHSLDPLLEQVKQMKEDQKELYNRKLKKRTITVTITSYQRQNNCFLGTIAIQGWHTLQEILLQESLVYCDKEGGAPEKFKEVEKKARGAQKGLWSPALINFEPVNQLDMQTDRFKGKFSWVEDGQTIFIQPQTNYKTLDMIAQKLKSKNMGKVTKDMMVIGSLVAAPYFQEFYRARILSIKPKGVKLMFVDWGNKETVDESLLRELPEALKLIEKQCLKAKLNLTRPSRNPQHLDKIRNDLMDGQEYQFKKEVGEYLSSYKNKQNISLWLIERGFVKSNTAMADADTKALIKEFEEALKKSKTGVWEWSDEEEESQEELDDD